MDRNSKVTYKRDPFDPHGAQNFTDKTPKGVATRDSATGDRSGTFYDRNRDIDLHVTQYYDDNQRVSWNTDGKTDRSRHWTNQNLDPGDPEEHTQPPGARK